MNKVRYAVRINPKKGKGKIRYIKWCDVCWYETESRMDYRFTFEQAEEICSLMENHYIYNMTIIGEDGTTYERGFKNPNKSEKKPEASVTPKKTLFKLCKATITRTDKK